MKDRRPIAAYDFKKYGESTMKLSVCANYLKFKENDWIKVCKRNL